MEDRGYAFVAEDGVPGRVVGGRYRLITEVGSGGMGRVWEARDEQLDRLVAVKEVRLLAASSVEREEQLRRAEREGRNAAALADHPNVVTVYDVVIEDGVPWIVMQLVRGQSLRTALDSGPLDPRRVTDIARALLTALRAVHSAGIVHRDVKPGNVMLTDDGRVLLTDFGIAKSGRDETVTDTGAFVGSLAYAAPERLEGEAGGPAGDLYSAGATLFHAVEGMPPFQRDSGAAMLTAILLHPLPPMRRADGGLRTLIAALTAKRPGERPGADEALELLADGRDSSAPQGAETMASPPQPSVPPRPVGDFTNWPPPAPFNQSQALGGPPGGTPRSQRIRAVAVACAVALILGTVAWLATASDGEDDPTSLADQVSTTRSTTKDPSTKGSSTKESSRTSSGATASPSATPTSTTTPSAETPQPDSTDSGPAAHDPASLDSAATDKTPLTVDALLARSFTNDKGVDYAIKSGGVEDCGNRLMSDRIRNALSKHGCSGLMVGTYTDAPDKLLVVVMVVVLPNTNSANAARAELASAYTGEWGLWCPPSGQGAQPCKQPAERIGQATQAGYIGTSHRYLTHTFAFYSNLAQDESLRPWIDSAALGASYAIGPQNYTGNS